MPRRRRRGVTQSYKKVLNYAPASIAAATKTDYLISKGVDSVAAGQTGPTDIDVPTGSIIEEIVIQFAAVNLTSIASFQWMSIQKTHFGQASIAPDAVGGHSQRNQVHLQLLRSTSNDQNMDQHIRFKVPKKFQRVREGDFWTFTNISNTIHTGTCQIIYKFLR